MGISMIKVNFGLCYTVATVPCVRPFAILDFAVDCAYYYKVISFSRESQFYLLLRLFIPELPTDICPTWFLPTYQNNSIGRETSHSKIFRNAMERETASR